VGKAHQSDNAIGLKKTKEKRPMAVTTVAGVIRYDGQILAQFNGTVTVTKPSGSPGKFRVAFDPPFKGLPAVCVNHVWNAGSAGDTGGSPKDTASLQGVQAGAFSVTTMDALGTIVPRTFSFMAIGER
jgi:hypothetical protein